MAAPEEPSDDARSAESSSLTAFDPIKSTLTSTAQPSAAKIGSAAASQPDPTKRTVTNALSNTPVLKPTSPKASRETSPTRTRPLKLAQGGAKLSRSRKNSQDLSPARSANPPAPTLPDAPSAAAVQRALSATGAPRVALPAAGEGGGDAQRPHRTSRAPNTTAAPALANTSRVKSPPRPAAPTKQGPTSRKSETSATGTPELSIITAPKPKSQGFFEGVESEETVVRNGTKSSAKSTATPTTLEAVQESTAPETPAIESGPSISSSRIRTSVAVSPDNPYKDSAPDSESEGSTTKKASGKDSPDEVMKIAQPQPPPRPAALQSQKSFSSLSTSKNKTGDGSSRNMTVETETVPSVPQLAVGGNPSDRNGGARSDGGGTLRVKPSTETIRPKKEKKKAVRKATSNAGGPTSKADIFEAKVASAVDEADSSDSGETFVYESNPPEPVPRTGQRYHHSRTPSATSMASQADAHGRLRAEGHNSIIGKKSMKSMKFTNSFNNLPDVPTDDDSQSGRNVTGNVTHHIGRWGRNNGSHVSILGNDATFTVAPARLRPGSQVRHSSRPNTPRNTNFFRSSASGKSYVYQNDVDDDDAAADDERTPLIHPSQAGRTRHSRRPASRYSGRYARQDTAVFKGICGWVLLALLISFLVAAVIVALVLCSKPLREVYIGDISNVIASEEEVVFDIEMFALNPNIVSIQVESLDMKVFARSQYVGSSAKRPDYYDLLGEEKRNDEPELGAQGGVDEGTDPIDEPGDADTMLLQHVYALDSPLSFSPSPFSREMSSDVGEISFFRPGNNTADDGTERWKTVVQHSFELIVVGQLKYTLPISSKTHSVSVGRGNTTVDPGKAKTGEGLGRPPMPGPVKIITYVRRAFVA